MARKEDIVLKIYFMMLLLSVMSLQANASNTLTISEFYDQCGPDTQLQHNNPAAMSCGPYVDGAADGLQYAMAQQGMRPMTCLPEEYPGESRLLLDRSQNALNKRALSSPPKAALNAILIDLLDQFWCDENESPKTPVYSYSAIAWMLQCAKGSEQEKIQCGSYIVGLYNTLRSLPGIQATHRFICPNDDKKSAKSIHIMASEYVVNNPNLQQLPLAIVLAEAMMEESPCN